MNTDIKPGFREIKTKSIMQIIIKYYLLIRELLFSNEVWVNAATRHGTVQEIVMALYPTVMMVRV